MDHSLIRLSLSIIISGILASHIVQVEKLKHRVEQLEKAKQEKASE